MHLSAEQLIELLHGEAELQDLESYLDHLDACPACALSFEVLVDLRAHNREALGALAVAPTPSKTIPFPVQSPPRPRSWTLQYLPLAASVALAFFVGLVVSSTPVDPVAPVVVSTQPSVADLATDEFVAGSRRSPIGESLVRTGGAPPLIEAIDLLERGSYAEAERWLHENIPPASDPDFDAIRLYLGIAQYFSANPGRAVATLRELESSQRTSIQRTALWYQANALLRLDRPDEALVLLERLTQNSSDAVLDRRMHYDKALDLEARIRERTRRFASAEQ